MDKILIERLRNKYIKNPPEGMTPEDIKHMSDSDLLDMDYKNTHLFRFIFRF